MWWLALRWGHQAFKTALPLGMKKKGLFLMLSWSDFKKTLLIKLKTSTQRFPIYYYAVPWKYCQTLNQFMVHIMLVRAALDDVTVVHLDAVGKLLQSFGSDRFHGGDECRQLVLGACRRALQTVGRCIDHIIPPSRCNCGAQEDDRRPTCNVVSNSDLFILRCLRMGKMVRTAE